MMFLALDADQRNAASWFEIGHSTPQNTDGHGSKKRVCKLLQPFWAQAQSSRVFFLPIFKEQIRTDNAKRLGGLRENPSKHLTVFFSETVNIKKWPI